MAVSFLGLIVLAILLLCLGGLVYLWVRVLRQPREQYAQCGQCGYMVEGLTTMLCPECGGDFRKVGIVTRKGTTISPVRFFVAWTVLFVPIAFALGMIMFTFVPRIVTRSWIVTATPASGAFGSVELHVTAQAPWGTVARPGPLGQMPLNQPADVIVVRSVAPMPQSTLAYFPQDDHYDISNGPVVTGPPDADAIRAWLMSINASPDVPGFDDAVADLQRLIVALGAGRTAVNTPQLNLQLRGAGGTSTAHPPYTLLIIALWLLIYIAGIIVYRRRRRLMERNRPGDARAVNPPT